MTDKINVNTVKPAGSAITLGASGGNVVMTDDVKINTIKDTGSNRVRAFTTAGANTWTCPTGVTEVEVLIVAGGGGGGGRYYAGGGGAGGIVHDTDYAVTAGVTYDITVGAGGARGAQDGNGGNGSNSVWNVNAEGSGATMTAVGGGGGSTANGTAGATGSGGGGAGGWSGTDGGAAGQPAVSGATVYATAGGDGTAQNAAGGGGAGGAGGDASSPSGVGGAGGVGREFTSFGEYGTNASNTTTGTRGYFGGGGGGDGGPNGSGGSGGVGGGGAGATYGTGSGTGKDPVAGSANTGAGGGGASHSATNGGTEGAAGGSGIVLIKYNADIPNTLWTSNGSGVVSSVNTAFGGAQKLLATSADVGSGVTSIAFTTGITSTYDEYIFKFDNIRASADYATIYFQCSIDGGSNYNIAMTSAAFWSWNYTGMNNQGLAVYGAGQGNTTNFQEIATNIGSDGTKGTAIGEVHLFAPGDTGFVKQWWSRTSNWRADDRVVDFYAGGYFNTTSAINAIKFQFDGNTGTKEFEDESRIKMYGVA